jgi:hypothetical protein
MPRKAGALTLGPVAFDGSKMPDTETDIVDQQLVRFRRLRQQIGTLGAASVFTLAGLALLWWNWEDIAKKPGVEGAVESIQRLPYFPRGQTEAVKNLTLSSQFTPPLETPVGACDRIETLRNLAANVKTDKLRLATGSSLRVINKCDAKVTMLLQVDADAPAASALPFVPTAGRVFATKELASGKSVIVDMSGQNTAAGIDFSFPGCPADHFHLPPGVSPVPRTRG